MKIAKEGHPFVVGSGIFTVLMLLVHSTSLFLIGIAVTLFIVYFFRDPERKIPTGENLVVSPADGWIIALEEVSFPVEGYTDERYRKISIFMTVFDVHVNRMPCSGTIRAVKYKPGKFLPAQQSKASFENEKNLVILKTTTGCPVALVQVAGILARRISFWRKEGEFVSKGERIGMIRFGSRVDLYVPLKWILKASKGQKVRAGETILCITT